MCIYLCERLDSPDEAEDHVDVQHHVKDEGRHREGQGHPVWVVDMGVLVDACDDSLSTRLCLSISPPSPIYTVYTTLSTPPQPPHNTNIRVNTKSTDQVKPGSASGTT